METRAIRMMFVVANISVDSNRSRSYESISKNIQKIEIIEILRAHTLVI